MLKTGVCGEYGLNFCTWMNCLTYPLMSKACEVKAGVVVRLAKYNVYRYIECIIDQSNRSGPFSLVVMTPD